MRSFEEIQAKLQELTNFVTDADAKIRGGEMVSLVSLDDEVAQICEEAVALPPEQAQAVQPLLAELIGKLETLSEALKGFQNQAEDNKE